MAVRDWFWRQSSAQATTARLEPVIAEDVSAAPDPATRQGAKLRKRFAAAAGGRLGPRLLGASLSLDEILFRDLATLRELSRKAGGDNGYVKKFFSMVETHVVGDKGFSFQNKAKLPDGSALDERANTLIEESFREWGKVGNCDVTERLSWIDIQTLFVKTVAQDGEILVRQVEGFPNKWGYALQLLEADHLDVNYNRDLPDGNRIRMGVELDPWGKHVAYHLLTNHPGDRSYMFGSTTYERIPAEEILLAYLPWRPGQNRGFPWAHAALLELHHIHGYKEAELTGARVAASQMFFYEPDPDMEPEVDENGEFDDEGDFLQEVEPGMGSVVPNGYKVSTTKFDKPGSSYGDFLKAGMRGASSGLDVSYNTVASDLEGVNFSSLRQAVLEDRDGWKKRQRWVREFFLERIAASWLRMSLTMGAISTLKLFDYPRLSVPCFMGRRWDWVDPLKDEKANTEGINNYTRSPMRIIRERGDDPEEVIEEIIDFEERIAKARAMRGQASKPGVQDEPESEEGAGEE